MLTWPYALLAAALVTGGAWLHGRSTGADGVQARWDAAEVQRERAIQAQEAQQRRRASAASTSYQTGAAARAKAQHSLRDDITAALSIPACPQEAPDALQLADLPVPAAALDRLRRAGADSSD